MIRRLLALDLYLSPPAEKQTQPQPDGATAGAPSAAAACQSSEGDGLPQGEKEGREVRQAQIIEGGGLGSGPSSSAARGPRSGWTEVVEVKGEGGGKDDMVKVSQWIRDEQEAMERESRKQEEAGVEAQETAELRSVVGMDAKVREEEDGDIFGGSRLKRSREEEGEMEAAKKR